MSQDHSKSVQKDSVQHSYEDFIRIPIIYHCFNGYMLYPPKRRVIKHLLTVYGYLCNLSHTVCMILMLYTMFDGKTINSVKKVIEYATLFTFAINADMKSFTSLHYGDIRRLSNKLAALYPKTTQARIDYHVNEFYWPRPLLLIIPAYFISTAVVAVGPLFQSIFYYIFRPGSEFLGLHFYPYLALELKHHTVWYNIGTYLLEWFHASQMVVSFMVTDLWLVCFQMQICIQLGYLNRTLQNFEPHRDHDLEDQQFLANLVAKHNTIFELENDLNAIYGGSLLFTLVIVGTIFCSVAVDIQIQGLTMEGVSLLVFMGAVISQLYLICYYGQLVNTLSTNIAYSAYSHNWHNASLSCKKHLQFIAMRAQQPIELTAMGYLPISLETFKQLMTLSYRCFALIHQMIKKN